MEPRAPTPERRLEAIERLADAGVPVGVMAAPIIPAVNDDEIETILTRAYAAGAREAGYVTLRLPLELREMFREWLAVHFPDKLQHTLSLIQSMHGGKDYDSQWGRRMAGSGPYAWMIGRRFEIAARKLGYRETPVRLRERPVPPPPSADAKRAAAIVAVLGARARRRSRLLLLDVIARLPSPRASRGKRPHACGSSLSPSSVQQPGRIHACEKRHSGRLEQLLQNGSPLAWERRSSSRRARARPCELSRLRNCASRSPI